MLPSRASSIFSNAYDYPKPDSIRRALGEMLGDGILSSEGEACLTLRYSLVAPDLDLDAYVLPFLSAGDVHKRQRR